MAGENGRPTGYKSEYDGLVFKFALLGATDAQIASFLGVTEQTLNNWKNKFPSFFESLKRGKLEADARVAQSLYHRAIGYSHPSEEIFCTKLGEVVRAETVKHYPPDATSAIFWLKNRQPERWRDAQSIHIHKEETLTDEQIATRLAEAVAGGETAGSKTPHH